jgi:hypothetical protein
MQRIQDVNGIFGRQVLYLSRYASPTARFGPRRTGRIIQFYEQAINMVS